MRLPCPTSRASHAQQKIVPPWASAENLPRGQHRHFAYPFQVRDDAVQMDGSQTALNVVSPMFQGANVRFAP